MNTIKEPDYSIPTDRRRVPEHLQASEIRRDISERKQSQEQAAQAAREWQDTFDAVGDVIWVLDQENRILRANKASEKVFHCPRTDLVGKYCWEVLYGSSQPNPGCPSTRARSSLCRETTDIQEGERWVKITVDPILGPAGQYAGAVHVISDITTRKREEVEREKLAEQLRISHKMEAIGSLATGVAHDFNNLLTVILSYTVSLLDGLREGDPSRNDLMEVKHAADRAVELTQLLLAFSSKQMQQPLPLSLNEIVSDVERMLRRILGEDIELVPLLAPDLGLTLADPSQIERALLNLVVHARDSMPRGGKLVIETSNAEIDQEYLAHDVAVRPGSYVMLAVTDSGFGMDAQTRSRIFEPFVSTKEADMGTGQGLSAVFGIVKQSGGKIWVYSEPGKGTTFKIFLPREFTAAIESGPRPLPISGPTIGSETILVVEDEEPLRKVAMKMLSGAGYTLLSARDGVEALQICTQHGGAIQLLLTDVVMPRMSGRALAQELLKIQPDLKILYMSGYPDKTIAHQGVLDAGFHFIGKPFAAADLLRKVRQVLDAETASPANTHAQAGSADRENIDTPLSEDASKMFPPELFQALRSALVAARYDEILAIIDTLRLSHSAAHAGLRRMAERFEYDGLLKLLGSEREGSRGG